MKTKFSLRWKVLAGCLIVAVIGAFILNKKDDAEVVSIKTENSNSTSIEKNGTLNEKLEVSPALDVQVGDPSQPKAIQKETTGDEPAFQLTAANFEGYVQRCFQGETCDLSDDPMKMYKDFKIAGNHKANDSLISFMRSKLKDPEFSARYKDLLKKMIDDFYPPEEKQFQEAAFYNYAGDLQKSLELYKDLEKKSELDPALRPAPKLNIANTLYDMGKFREALPYYESARQEYISGQQQVAVPSSNQMIGFIEDRISIIKNKL